MSREVDDLFFAWRAMRIEAVKSEVQEKAVKPIKRLLIVPCDPWTLNGSKGDEAMISGVVDCLQKQFGSIEVAVGVASESARTEAIQRGMIPFSLNWDCRWNPESAENELRHFDPDLVIVVGADVMDGYYSPLTTARLLVFGDVSARMGIRSLILGFSFNEKPNRLLRKFFDSLDSRLRVNIRDSISLARFNKFSTANARLVADAAFMLQADYSGGAAPEVASWVARQHDQGRVTLAFNIHPMLIKNATPSQCAEIIRISAEALKKTATEKEVSVLLLSHDYRGSDGDDVCLEPIHAALEKILFDHIFYPRLKMSAAQLKGVASYVDGVITGRMHLAIASLGQGVPVAALTYQDKFQGLFAHFQLPSSLLIPFSKINDANSLERLIVDFLRQLKELRVTVEGRLPRVKSLAESNIVLD